MVTDEKLVAGKSLERLQNRLNALQSSTAPVAQASGSVPASGDGIPGFPGAQFLIDIRDRINRITEEVSSLVNRFRASIGPTSTPAPIA